VEDAQEFLEGFIECSQIHSTYQPPTVCPGNPSPPLLSPHNPHQLNLNIRTHVLSKRTFLL
jgi:hypothetical protein